MPLINGCSCLTSKMTGDTLDSGSSGLSGRVGCKDRRDLVKTLKNSFGDIRLTSETFGKATAIFKMSPIFLGVPL